MRKSLLVLMIAVVLTISAGIASASTLLFDRGLPTDNLNNAGGTDRSNVTWGSLPSEFGGIWLVGDDFQLGGLGDYLVDTISIWTVDINTDFSLWLGEKDGTFTNYSFYASSSVKYSNNTTYQVSPGAYSNLYKMDFSIGKVLSGAKTYQFFLDNSSSFPFYIHSSNAALSGSTQQGADNSMLTAYRWNDDGTLALKDDGTVDVSSWSSNSSVDPLLGKWDKSSDANVQVYGTPVPEPATMLLFGFGILGIAGVSRKKSKMY